MQHGLGVRVGLPLHALSHQSESCIALESSLGCIAGAGTFKPWPVDDAGVIDGVAVTLLTGLNVPLVIPCWVAEHLVQSVMDRVLGLLGVLPFPVIAEVPCGSAGSAVEDRPVMGNEAHMVRTRALRANPISTCSRSARKPPTAGLVASSPSPRA